MAWERHRLLIHEKWKKEWFQTHPPEIAEYSWDYLFTGGKEIRARLFCELWAYLSPDSEVAAELAFAIECIHVASLILDDSPYMDNAVERRGKTTLHIRFSQKKAALLCYDVMNMARAIWLQQRPSHLSTTTWNLLIKTKLQRLMIGQWYDMEKKGSVYDLASLKTGVLFELVAETVAVCIGLDADFWRQWGNHVGVLFQWVDDWQDREEDRRQGSRNAFHESEDTIHHYQTFWRQVEQGIGSSWFQRPFGQYMRQYFTGSLPLSTASFYPSPLPSLSSLLDLPKVDKSTVNLSGRDILSLLFMASNHVTEHDRIHTTFWNIPEEEWAFHPEIEEILHEWHQRTGWNVRPLYQKWVARI